jgi:hypothetical protein
VEGCQVPAAPQMVPLPSTAGARRLVEIAQPAKRTA